MLHIFLVVPWFCVWSVVVAFPGHSRLLFAVRNKAALMLLLLPLFAVAPNVCVCGGGGGG